MEALKQDNPEYKIDVIHHLDEIKISNNKLILYNNKDINLVRALDNINKRIDLVKDLIVKEPRFLWQVYQAEIDRLHKTDPELTGVDIYIDWKETETPRRAQIKSTILKNSNTGDNEIR